MFKFIICFLFLFAFNSHASIEINSIQSNRCQINCLIENIVGMSDIGDESIARSKKDGVSVQFVITQNKSLINMGFDEKKLANEINDFAKEAGIYFKKHPEQKGILTTTFFIFPGYITPFQFDISKVSDKNKKSINKINSVIKSESKCNEQKFCSLLAITDVKYKGEKSDLFKFDELNKIISQNQNNLWHFPSNSNSKMVPVPIFIIIGTNGYSISSDEANEILNKIKENALTH